GFAELAIRYRARVVPVAIIGAEECWPVAARLRAIRTFRIPYLPIPMSPLPLPAHYHLRYGDAIQFDRDPAEADDQAIVASAARDVQIALENLMSVARGEREGVWR
ncbi:MAG: hypothetical protein ABI678_01545, partial [Kofleriaceae bacterium]